MVINSKLMKIGVIAVQGAVPEHIKILKRSMKNLEIDGDTIPVRKVQELEKVDGIIIPGGESTTISKLLIQFNLFEHLQQKAKENLPIMGTCAGNILLAKETKREIKDQKLLELMDIKVERNAFGSQRESFECDIEINGFNSAYHAIFIRAPVIIKIWGNCKVLAKVNDKIVFAQQGNLLACSFHPELTKDTRIHEMFLKMILD